MDMYNTMPVGGWDKRGVLVQKIVEGRERFSAWVVEGRDQELECTCCKASQ
jgi:hypothetical protein